MADIALLGAAFLLFAIGCAHSYLGERWLIGPILSPQYRRGMLEKSEFARQVLRFAWHLTTLAIWGYGAILAAIALAGPGQRTSATLIIVSGVCLISAVYIFAAAGGRHLAWPVFAVAGALCLVPLAG